MLSNWPASLALVLKSEGGFSNHSADPGGVTMLGVTKKVWEAWVKHPVDVSEMRALTPELVAPLYKSQYWDACKCDDLPRGIDYAVFDSAVNMGAGRAAKLLQAALGVKADGIIGRGTLGVAVNADPDEFLDKFSAAKENFYRGLQTFDVFGKGWLRRVADVKQMAEGMIA